MAKLGPNSETDRLRRRSLLRAGACVATSAVAGCLSGFGAPSGSGQQSTSPTSTRESTESPSQAADTVAPSVTIESPWSQYRHDSRNSGFNAQADDSVVVATHAEGVYALDTDDGTTQWQSASTHSGLTVTPVVAAGTVVVGRNREPDGIYAYAPLSGTERWTVSSGESTTTAAVAEETVYANTAEGLLALNIDDGTEQWRFEREDGFSTSLTLSDESGFILQTNGTIYAIDTATGDQAWSRVLGAPIEFGAFAPAVLEETVYVADEDTVHALDRDSGLDNWTADINDGLQSPLVATTDTVYAAHGYSGGRITALSRADGTTRWDLTVDGRITDPLAVGSERLYCTLEGGQLKSINRSEGEISWSATVPEFNAGLSAGTDTVYVTGRSEGTLSAINSTDGSERWQVDLGDSVMAPPAVVGDITEE